MNPPNLLTNDSGSFTLGLLLFTAIVVDPTGTVETGNNRHYYNGVLKAVKFQLEYQSVEQHSIVSTNTTL